MHLIFYMFYTNTLFLIQLRAIFMKIKKNDENKFNGRFGFENSIQHRVHHNNSNPPPDRRENHFRCINSVNSGILKRSHDK
jgi:hypothetical protein